MREQEFVEKEDLPATVEVFHDNFDHEVHRFDPVDQFALQLDHLVDCLETGHTTPDSRAIQPRQHASHRRRL